MKPLAEIFTKLETTKSESEIRVKLETADTEAQLEQLRLDVRSELETTGSNLHDGLVVLYGRELLYNQKIAANYERISSELAGNIGQPVLVVHRWIDNSNISSARDAFSRSDNFSVCLGIVRGQELLFDYAQHTCSLPTKRYGLIEHAYYDKDPLIQLSGLMVANREDQSRHIDLGRDLDRDIGPDRTIYQSPELTALTIAIGREGIASYLAAAGNDVRVSEELKDARSICKKLKIKPIKPVTELQKKWVED